MQSRSMEHHASTTLSHAEPLDNLRRLAGLADRAGRKTDESRQAAIALVLSSEIYISTCADISRSMHLRCRRLLRRYSVGTLL